MSGQLGQAQSITTVGRISQANDRFASRLERLKALAVRLHGQNNPANPVGPPNQVNSLVDEAGRLERYVEELSNVVDSLQGVA